MPKLRSGAVKKRPQVRQLLSEEGEGRRALGRYEQEAPERRWDQKSVLPTLTNR